MKKIYIIHGWTYTVEKWDPFLEGLKAQGFAVEFLRVPGLTAPIDKPWTLDDYVEWLRGVLQNESEPVILLGHSNGGRIAIAFTHAYPEKVKQLILIGSAGVYHRDIKTRLKRMIFGQLALVGGSLKRWSTIRKMFYMLVRERDYRDANPTMQQTMKNLIAVDLVPLLSQIICPVLLIWGKYDNATPLPDGKIMEKTFPHAQLVVIEEGRHTPQFTHVSEVLEAVNHFYESNL